MKITRIAFNEAEWRYPTGSAAKHEIAGSFTNINGFGLEEWLFRDEWQIGGWRYAFIEGVNKSRRPLLKDGKPFDVTLFTIERDMRRRYVANIEGAECLDDAQAADAVAAFEKEGWLAAMKQEVRNVGGNVDALDRPKVAPSMLNVRFRLDNVHRFPPGAFANQSDPVKFILRYQLRDIEKLRAKYERSVGNEAPTDFPSIAPYVRRGSEAVSIDPIHRKMQIALMKKLRTQFPQGRVIEEFNAGEFNRIDVLVELGDERRIYEIKSDLSVRTVLRLALGQLLDYSYRVQHGSAQRKVTLIAVGRNELSEEDASYLAHLKKLIGLPLEYLTVEV